MAGTDLSTPSLLVRTPLAALRDRKLSRGDLRVLMALGSFADRSGRCWPSRAALARLTAYPVTRISEITGRLCRLGLLEKEGRGGRSSCRYRILWDDGGARESTAASVRAATVVTPAVTPGGDGWGPLQGDPELPSELSKEELLLRPSLPQSVPAAAGAAAPGGSSADGKNNFSQKNRDSGGGPPAENQMPSACSPSAGTEPALPGAPGRVPAPSVASADTPVPPSPSPDAPAPASADAALVFPPGIEPAFALILIATLSGHARRQAVLDELAGRLRSGRVRYRYGYLKALAERMRQGLFIPDTGRAVAEERRHRALLREAGARTGAAPLPSAARLWPTAGGPPPSPPSGRLGNALERLGRTLRERRRTGAADRG